MEVIRFHAYWDNASEKYAQVFKNVSKKKEFKRIKFTDVDAETKFGVELSCKYEVRNLPATLIIDSRKNIFVHLKGSKTEEELVNAIMECKNKK